MKLTTIIGAAKVRSRMLACARIPSQEYDHAPAGPPRICAGPEVAGMYARVLRLTGSAERTDDGVENYKSRVAPALRDQDGYGGARLLVNRETGTGMSVTFWRDEAASRASFEALTNVRAEASSRFGAETPETKVYEVVVQHRPQPTEAGNWVRLTTMRGDPTKAEDGVRHFESQVIPDVSKLHGFRAAVLFLDRTTGEAMVVTVWDGKSDLDASSSQAGPIRTAAAEVMGANDPQVEGYEVAFAELLAPVSS
jgi:heme-degrading monooxygenase HmoA